jgi:8-oxo-dGTP pyrophosphatase MutT (NUDIX family)
MDASEDLEEPIDQNDSLEDHIRRDHETDPNLQVSIKAIFLQVRQSEDGQRELCVLLGHHRRHNKYLLPGGRIENDDFDKGFLFESVLDRELREELGLRCRDFANPYFPIQEETFPPNTVLRDYWGGEHTDLSDNYSNYPPPNGDGGLNRIE